MLYRQVARILTLKYPGRPAVRSVRPHRETSTGRIIYLDMDMPTVLDITGDERGFRVDLALKQGIIAPYEPDAISAPAPRRRRKGG